MSRQQAGPTWQMRHSDDVRRWFTHAGNGLVQAAGALTPGHLGRPGLGEWTVRDLLGHASRSFLTIETYLASEPSVDSWRLDGPVAYYRAALPHGTEDAEEITERGRAAGRALGEDPADAVRKIAERVLALVADTPDVAAVCTPFGVLPLVEYLPTRAFELTVHGLDLVAAAGIPTPYDLLRCAPAAVRLCVDLSADPVAILQSLTGRRTLPAGFTVL